MENTKIPSFILEDEKRQTKTNVSMQKRRLGTFDVFSKR